VSVFWDGGRALNVAVCERCCDGLESERADQVDDWANSHCCDPELAALLALAVSGRVA
jgi:hypothetical protein